MSRERSYLPNVGTDMGTKKSNKRSPEDRMALGTRFVMDLAMALNEIEGGNKPLPTDTCGFISTKLVELTTNCTGLSDDEKNIAKTHSDTIRDWLNGKALPKKDKFNAIVKLLEEMKAPQDLIPSSNFSKEILSNRYWY